MKNLPLITVAASSVVTVLLTLGWRSYTRSQERQSEQRKRLSSKINLVNDDPTAYADELIHEQLSRNAVFLGPKGLAQLRSSTVLVVGCGAVGSWVITMMVRSGCGRVILLEDTACPLSEDDVRSHAVANMNHVGQMSSSVLKGYLAKVAPWVKVDIYVDAIEGGFPLDGVDYVVDASEKINVKLDLISAVVHRNIPMVSAIPTRGKTDPTAVRIGDIAHTIDDVQAEELRRKLKLRGIMSNIPVIYSTEKPKTTTSSFNGNTLPGYYGMMLATHAMVTIAQYETPNYTTPVRFKSKFYDPSLHYLIKQIRALFPEVPDSEAKVRQAWRLSNVIYTIEEVFKSHSVISGQVNKWALSVWRSSDTVETAVEWRNVVLMTKDEAIIHEREVLRGGKSCEEVYGEEICETVERRWLVEEGYH